jgi:hypothetical protein
MHTVATLLVVPAEMAAMAVKKFRQTPEIDSLIAARYEDLVRNPHSFIPQWKVRIARRMYPTSTVSLGYLFRHLARRRKDICHALASIPPNYRLLCQVETPSPANLRYKNIDIGFTSNGKMEACESHMTCSIRETREEARIQLRPEHYAEDYQKKVRKEKGINLPLRCTSDSVVCYFICM